MPGRDEAKVLLETLPLEAEQRTRALEGLAELSEAEAAEVADLLRSAQAGLDEFSAAFETAKVAQARARSGPRQDEKGASKPRRASDRPAESDPGGHGRLAPSEAAGEKLPSPATDASAERKRGAARWGRNATVAVAVLAFVMLLASVAVVTVSERQNTLRPVNVRMAETGEIIRGAAELDRTVREIEVRKDGTVFLRLSSGEVTKEDIQFLLQPTKTQRALYCDRMIGAHKIRCLPPEDEQPRPDRPPREPPEERPPTYLPPRERCRQGMSAVSCIEAGNAAELEGDYSAAVVAYDKGCELGSSQSCFRAGDLYDGSRLGVPDPLRAQTQYDKACYGTPPAPFACYPLAQHLLRTGREGDSRAIESLQRACAANQRNACEQLGGFYARAAHGLRRDDVRARSLFEKACNLGDQLGCTDLALFLFGGRGGPKDDLRAGQLREAACNHSIADACEQLGFMYRVGRGVPRDQAKAQSFYIKARSIRSRRSR